MEESFLRRRLGAAPGTVGLFGTCLSDRYRSGERGVEIARVAALGAGGLFAPRAVRGVDRAIDEERQTTQEEQGRQGIYEIEPSSTVFSLAKVRFV